MRGAARPPRGSGGTPPVGEDAVVTLHQILNSSWHKPDYRDRIELAPNVPVQGTECRSSAVSLMQDHSTLQVHRLDCFTKCLANVSGRGQAPPSPPGHRN